MRLLETFPVYHGSELKYIKLYHGDLARIPAEEAVDLLVVSAFPDDYVPTSTSLIGALDRAGLSVQQLARDKAADLRANFSCWLSKDLARTHPTAGFRRILCFEPRVRGKAPEVVGDVFRAIMPFAFGNLPISTIAMPVLASGDQQVDSEVMLRALFDAAVHWLEHGAPLTTIKIVAFDGEAAQRLARLFARLAQEHAAAPGQRGSASPAYDVFLSYAREDSDAAERLRQGLMSARPALRLFVDRLAIKIGAAWQQDIFAALESCRKVIALYSPSYLGSKVCQVEFNMACMRHYEGDTDVLLPIYLRDADPLPLHMRALNYIDCREADAALISGACDRLVSESLA